MKRRNFFLDWVSNRFGSGTIRDLARIEIFPEEIGRSTGEAAEGEGGQPSEEDRLSICHPGSSGISLRIDERGFEMKAIALLSGGLDSTLAARWSWSRGSNWRPSTFLTVFCTCTNRGETCLASQKAVETLGIPLRVFNVSEEYLDVVKHPKHGYGSNMNPCIDCRIFMLKKGKGLYGGIRRLLSS